MFELQFRTVLQALDWKYAGLAENLRKTEISGLYLKILVQEIWDGAQDCVFSWCFPGDPGPASFGNLEEESNTSFGLEDE